MPVAILMATVCLLGVAFYARFLFALCKECRHRRICYLVLLQSHSPEHAIPDDDVLNESIPWVA